MLLKLCGNHFHHRIIWLIQQRTSQLLSSYVWLYPSRQYLVCQHLALYVFKGFLQSIPVTILVNSGSSASFVNASIVPQLHNI